MIHRQSNLSELDEAWAFALSEAESRARQAGRGDIAKYLALRKSNDSLRKIGIQWLISTFEVLAAEANRRGGSIQIARKDKHRFQVGTSTMVGNLLTLTVRVRVLTIEAGWPRAPRDGVVRGGGLAVAHIKHLGIRPANEELLLVQSNQGSPCWVLHDSRGRRLEFREANLRRHIAILLGE